MGENQLFELSCIIKKIKLRRNSKQQSDTLKFCFQCETNAQVDTYRSRKIFAAACAHIHCRQVYSSSTKFNAYGCDRLNSLSILCYKTLNIVFHISHHFYTQNSKNSEKKKTINESSEDKVLQSQYIFLGLNLIFIKLSSGRKVLPIVT